MPYLISRIVNCLEDKAIKYCIDYPVHSSLFSNRAIRIKGWIVSKEAPVKKILIFYNNDTIGKIVPNIHRKQVSEIFSEYYNSSKPGFDIYLSNISDGVLLLKAYLDDGLYVDVVKFFIEKKVSWPHKVLYVHIPKTGGSSVNRFISSHFSYEKSFVHVESSPGWHKDILNKEIFFISGHIRYPVFKELLGSLDDFLKVVTLRDPISHVISHLAWIRHLSAPGQEERFNNHPLYIQGLSEKLANITLGSPEHISELIKEMNNYERELMDNTQTRYLSKIASGAYVSTSDIELARNNLKEFDVIGTTEEIDGFIGSLSIKAGWEYPASSSAPKLNVMSEKYGMDSNNRELVAALMPLIKYDIELYDSLGKSVKA